MTGATFSGDDREGTGAGFHTTHWTVVMAARTDDSVVAREALASLCSTYWYPLYAFIRRRGFNPHEAEDFTQEFLMQFIERDALAGVDPAAGKFRSYLLACLKHFLSNQRERARAQRRGGGQSPIPLEFGDAETRYSLEPADKRTPEAVFEQRWAFAAIEQALASLRAEYAATGKADVFEDLKGFLPAGVGNVSRADLATRRGVTVGAIDVAVHRLRQRFGTLLREQVRRTVATEAEVVDELRHLLSVFAA